MITPAQARDMFRTWGGTNKYIESLKRLPMTMQTKKYLAAGILSHKQAIDRWMAENLNEREREIIKLCYVDGLLAKEAASVVHSTLGLFPKHGISEERYRHVKSDIMKRFAATWKEKQ